MKALKIVLDFLATVLTNKVFIGFLFVALAGGNVYQFIDPMEKKATPEPIIIEVGDKNHEHSEYAERHSHPYAREVHRHPTSDKIAKDHGYAD
jgi:hypothetical protein